jgi:hypothetical protein
VLRDTRHGLPSRHATGRLWRGMGGGAGDGATGHVFFRTTQYKKRLTGCEGLDGVPEIDGLHGCLRIG